MLADWLKDAETTDHPLRIRMERYDLATELLVDAWTDATASPAVAVYQIGQVRAAGISDLDFVLVFPDDARLDWNRFRPDRFPRWIHEVLTHAPYCCSLTSWQWLEAWYPLFDIRLVAGNHIPRAPLGPEFRPGVALGMLVDYFIVKIPRDVIWMATERPIRVRTLLCMLHSLKYTSRLAEMASIPVSPAAQSLIEGVTRLRQEWFNLNPQERRIGWAGLVSRSLETVVIMLRDLDRRLSANDKDFAVQFEASKDSTGLFSFAHPWQERQALERAVETACKSDRLIWTNPESLLRVLSVYAEASAGLSRYFRSNGCSFSRAWDGGDWTPGLALHAQAMQQYQDDAWKLGVPSQKYVALGYRPAGGAIRGLGRRIRSRMRAR